MHLLSILRYTLFNLLLIMIYRSSVILAHYMHTLYNKCAPLPDSDSGVQTWSKGGRAALGARRNTLLQQGGPSAQ